MLQYIREKKRSLLAESLHASFPRKLKTGIQRLYPRKGHQQQNKGVFAWKELNHFINAPTYSLLCSEFPGIEYFEKHEGIPRGYNQSQRPHNRYYLALDNSIYSEVKGTTPALGKGIIDRASLSESWQSFIEYLEGGFYRSVVSQFLRTSAYDYRFAWHLGYAGCEVSPHIDHCNKLGTHIFYFNSSENWQPEWGGQTLVLEHLQRRVDNPEFEDFKKIHEISNIGNNSLLLRNTGPAWHGVRPLTSPKGQFRKIFTVVFNALESEE